MNERECETCIRRKTIYCPNSKQCFATENKPYYQNRIMLLEENQKYKEVINKVKQFCDNDDNFLILDAYSQDDVYEIQEKLLGMLNEVEDK